jgi:hypothetical protein
LIADGTRISSSFFNSAQATAGGHIELSNLSITQNFPNLSVGEGALRTTTRGTISAGARFSDPVQGRNSLIAYKLDWREELSWAIHSLEQAQDEHARQIDEARRHVLHNLVLDERDVTRLGLYERQVAAQFKSTYSLLERART